MKNYLILFLLLGLLFSSCITILHRGIDDGYSQADKQQFTSYANASANNAGYKIVEINAQDFKNLLSENDDALVVVWATWCGRCVLELPSLMEEAKTKPIFFICSNYDIKGINKIFSGKQFNKPVYIISSAEYGADETIKTEKFLSQLSGSDSLKAAFPKHLYFKNGNYTENIKGAMNKEIVSNYLKK